VDAQLELRRLHDGQIRWVCPLEDTARINADLTIRLGPASTVTHQSADFDVFGVGIGGRNAMARCEKHQLDATRGKKGTATDNQSVWPLARERGEGGVNLASVARLKNSYLQTHCAGCWLYLFYVPSSDLRVARINQHR